MGKHSDFRIWIGWPLEVRMHPLPPPGLACVMQDLKLLSFNAQWFRDLGASFSGFGCFVFESWVLRFRVLGASFSKFGCFVFEIWVLRFRDLGASCFGLRFRVLRFRNYHWQMFLFQELRCITTVIPWRSFWLLRVFKRTLYHMQSRNRMSRRVAGW